MGTAEVQLLLKLSDVKMCNSWRFSPGRKFCPVDIIEEGEIVYQCNATGFVIPSTQTLNSKECVLNFSLNGYSDFTKSTIPAMIDLLAPQVILNAWDSHSLFQFDILLKGDVSEEYLNGDLVKALKVAAANKTLKNAALEIKKIHPQNPRAHWVRDFYKNANTLNNVQVILKFKTRKYLKILSELQNHPDTRNQNIFSLISMSKKILLDDPHSDFQIEAEGMVFPCHKCFLAARSPVLARMLSSNMSEVRDKKLKIDDMSGEGVKAFLVYIYCGDVKAAMTNARIAFEIFRAGHKYEMPDLVAVSQQILLSTEPSSYDAETAMGLLQFGKTVEGFQLLKQKAVIVYKENVEKMMEEGVIWNAPKP